MLGVCLRYTRSLQEAEDILQDGFIRVLKFVDSYKAEGSLEGWIRKIMVNTALNHYRSNLKYRLHENVEDYQMGTSDDPGVYGMFDVEDLMKLIQSLPLGYRMVFNLFEIEGYSHKEIAGMLKISVNTSKSQLMKARAMLRSNLTSLKETMNLTNEDEDTK
jgi:RNA polymerase sigma-70 factor (ECF subfamily)